MFLILHIAQNHSTMLNKSDSRAPIHVALQSHPILQSYLMLYCESTIPAIFPHSSQIFFKEKTDLSTYF